MKRAVWVPLAPEIQQLIVTNWSLPEGQALCRILYTHDPVRRSPSPHDVGIDTRVSGCGGSTQGT